MELEDSQIKGYLQEIGDNEDLDLDSQTIDFIENVGYRWKGPLTDKQREWALDIIEKYGDQ